MVLHVVAAAQLTAAAAGGAAGGLRRRAAKPQVSTLASRTIRWGGALILVFLVYHILHFTIGTAHPRVRGAESLPQRRHRASRNPLVVLFYLVAMAAVGLHLYHGVWSSGRSLGVSPPSPHPLQRRLALALAAVIWLGFTAIVVAAALGMIGVAGDGASASATRPWS